MNIKVASRWFNLSNAFLNMVFKHFGNEKAHNGLDWSSYFLSQLSSWASPSGLDKFQKRTLYSCIPVSLLTFATVTSDSLSCLHFIKICSSRETVASPFLPSAHAKKRHWTRDSVLTSHPHSPDFYDRGLICFCKTEGKLRNTTFRRTKKKKIKVFAPDISKRRWTWNWSYHATWEKTSNRKRNLISQLLK